MKSSHPTVGEAAAAIGHRHDRLLERVRALSGALLDAVEAGDTVTAHDEKANLVSWCEDELIPHLVAEEGPLYGGAHATAEAGLLVEGLLQEHQTLVGLVDELRRVDGGARPAALGLVIARVLALHIGKEERLLLPFIAASPGLSLAEAVGTLEDVTEA
ncbi:hemerythrin domain-containing protein [Sinomonas sp. ASV322]|uniref:hemerythrin domain-containing protein n=1 Tax=Sinomonas sp. ASV322 TaxID=3041920 RepID=UPI0027DC3499|nr:hemerythrin domain-containing protein [Sinomonas sp. ASV322]MDQ4504480.1 hemerythrin domain-containing protein [Sinomonas sp. ASV322]